MTDETRVIRGSKQERIDSLVWICSKVREGIVFVEEPAPADKPREAMLNARRMRVVAMKIYETSATVEDQGRVHVAGVPFEPGTEVDITISPKRRFEEETTNDEALAAARKRMRELFRSIQGFRNSPRIPREELYERGSVR